MAKSNHNAALTANSGHNGSPFQRQILAFSHFPTANSRSVRVVCDTWRLLRRYIFKYLTFISFRMIFVRFVLYIKETTCDLVIEN